MAYDNIDRAFVGLQALRVFQRICESTRIVSDEEHVRRTVAARLENRPLEDLPTETTIADLIAELLHFADVIDADIDEILVRAREYHDTEIDPNEDDGGPVCTAETFKAAAKERLLTAQYVDPEHSIHERIVDLHRVVDAL